VSGARADARSRTALVTGASRGVGKGIALGLAEAGWTVHVSGRDAAALDRAVADLDAIGEPRGGRAVAHVCDHTDDEAVRALVDEVVADDLALLVNNVWAGPLVNPFRPEPFWTRPLNDWDSLIGVGLRPHYVAAHAAAPALVARGGGLIVNVSSFGARGHLHSVLYGMGKAALDKMTHDAALELRPHGVHVVGLWPGLVQTELLVASGLEEFEGFRIADGETPLLQGRVVAAVADDPALSTLTGSVVVTAEAAVAYGLTEDDGRQPASHRDIFGGGPLHPPLPPLDHDARPGT